MTADTLLEIIGEARETYVLSALDSRNGKTKTHKRLSISRTVLIAAVIALLLLLAGCVAVFLRLQDMSIGQETYTERFDDQGKAIEPTEKTRDILTFYGHSGDPIQRAMKEWYDFIKIYDPNRELMTNEADLPDVPNQYEYIYGCYTPEMAAKVDEISAKYHLKLLDTEMLIQLYQSDFFMDELGIADILLPNADAAIKDVSGIFYPPYNFRLDFRLMLNGQAKGLYATVHYSRKDYFPTGVPGGTDLSTFVQWDHTTPDGTKVLLAISNKGVAYIITEQKNAMLFVSIDGNFSDSKYPDKDEIITKEQLEAIADLFNYSVQPRETDLALLQAKLDEAESAYQEAHTYVPEKYAGFNDYLMRTVRHNNYDVLYTFFDLTGDGKEELLIGQDGGYTTWISMEDGQAVIHDVSPTYLCEGRVIEEASSFPDSKFEKHCYFAPVSDTAILSPDSHGEIITVLTYKEGIWYQGKEMVIFTAEPIPQEKAESIIAQYPRLELQWQPLLEYPLDANGLTLGEYVQQFNTPLSSEELRQVYADFIMQSSEDWYTHYQIMDINSDGVEDLLVSGDGEKFWGAYTYHYGQIIGLIVSDFYLCDDNIVEHYSINALDYGRELEVHKYVRYYGYDQNTLDFVAYNKSTASWQSDRDGTEISEADANAIIAKYPRANQGMKPIRELTGN